ncbi:MAG: tetratricopeptide repeat protein [Flavobacteriales bacterium]|nr:tetratricopeptide repeat protein [Flavobacteriales bacterium]MCC6938091.1 tetratricopeptide repeat protein [Flavobacteriales bacterium]
MRHLLFTLVASATLCACTDPGTEQGSVPGAALDLKLIEQHILDRPNDPNAYADRALYYEHLDSSALAESDWKRTILLDSTNTRWRIALGDLYFRKVRLMDAEQRFQEAIRLEPNGTKGRSKLSEVYLMQGRYPEAMTVANDALRIDPQDASLYNLKGWIHRTAGDTNLAISSYHTAVERDPQFYDAYISLGILHAARQDPLALEYYNSALEIRPESVEALYNKAIFAQEHGRDSLALVCYEHIIAVEPKYPLAYYNRGYVYLEHQKRVADARREFNTAIQLLPDYTAAYYNRGLTYELDSKLDSALLDYQQALRLDPGFTPAAQGLGRLQDRGVAVKLR